MNRETNFWDFANEHPYMALRMVVALSGAIVGLVVAVKDIWIHR